MKNLIYSILILSLLIPFGCRKEPPLQDIDGHWRAVWLSQGGEIPCDFIFKTSENGELRGEVHNAEEVIPFSRIERSGPHINLFIDIYECLISADIAEDGRSMTGNWSKKVGGTPVGLPFDAFRGDLDRFPVEKYPTLEGTAPIQDVSGTWKYVWDGGSPDEYMVMTFRQTGDRVTASVRSVFGDWRWLEGIYRNGRLRLSMFNGTWVSLLSAEMDRDGTLRGICVKRADAPRAWHAVREDVDLPDPFAIARLNNREGLFRFEYPLADSPETRISQNDPRFQGRPLVVAFTSSGCPNGHDNAALLSKMYRDYHQNGLEMLFVNYEFDDDLSIIQTRVRRFRDAFDLPIPIAYSLAKNKAAAGEELPDLERFVAHPTTFFLNREGRVAAIHTGMDGPATGGFYVKLEQKYRKIIESLLRP